MSALSQILRIPGIGGGGSPALPVIAVQPQPIEVYEGQDAGFSVTATGATGYQWQTSPNNSTWTNVGTDSSNYTIPATVRTTHDALYVRCRVTNATGTADSNSVQVSVWNPLALGADLACWLDPTFGRFTERTGASATTSAINGDPVGTWRARNGTINGTAGADGQRAIYRATGLNGTPAIEFDGVDDWFNFITDLSSTFQNKSYGYVFHGIHPESENVSAVPIRFAVGGTPSLVRAGTQSNRNNTANLFGVNARRLDADSATSLEQSAPGVNVCSAEFLWGIGELHMRINGARVQSTTISTGATSNTASASVSLGADGSTIPGQHYDGMIGHLIVTCPASAHSSDAMRKIEGFIAYKQGTVLV